MDEIDFNYGIKTEVEYIIFDLEDQTINYDILEILKTRNRDPKDKVTKRIPKIIVFTKMDKVTVPKISKNGDFTYTIIDLKEQSSIHPYKFTNSNNDCGKRPKPHISTKFPLFNENQVANAFVKDFNLS
jgi:GTP-binding protein EngB required for normal cell division